MEKAASKTAKAVLFRSRERFDAFRQKIESYGVECVVLDFAEQAWLDFDYGTVDFLIYYPSFEYTSNHPLALQKVHDNLIHLRGEYPDLPMFPDPNGIRYYNDKYRQFLFLTKHGFPIPKTIPLLSAASLDEAERSLGYPLILKNRYGAGGGSVFKVHDRRELETYYRMSTLDFWNPGALRMLAGMVCKRLFLYHLIKGKRMMYPFLSPPLLAQECIAIDRDLKTVVGDGQVVEGHWRHQAHDGMWKMNIDDGGIGVWSEVPEKALDISLGLAKALDVSWLNLDFLINGDAYYISEFSPVWHHYAYQEKSSFVYQDDYNLMPLEISLDLERIIVESLLRRCGHPCSPVR
jgi:hypothetical protein